MADEERRAHLDDADYYGLNWQEQIHYFGRLSHYWGTRVAFHRERADRYGRIAGRFRLATFVLVGVVLLIQFVGWVLR